MSAAPIMLGYWDLEDARVYAVSWAIGVWARGR